MECNIRWLGRETMSFIAESGSGHSFVMDTSEEGGGRNLGPRPMETILSGVVACTTYDVLNHLRIKKQEVDGCKVKVNAERAETDPKIFKKIHMHFIIEGTKLHIPLEGLIDVEAEIERNLKNLEKHNKSFFTLSNQLENKKFLSNAPRSLIKERKNNFKEVKLKISTLEKQIKILKKIK